MCLLRPASLPLHNCPVSVHSPRKQRHMTARNRILCMHSTHTTHTRSAHACYQQFLSTLFLSVKWTNDAKFNHIIILGPGLPQCSRPLKIVLKSHIIMFLVRSYGMGMAECNGFVCLHWYSVASGIGV